MDAENRDSVYFFPRAPISAVPQTDAPCKLQTPLITRLLVCIFIYSVLTIVSFYTRLFIPSVSQQIRTSTAHDVFKVILFVGQHIFICYQRSENNIHRCFVLFGNECQGPLW